VLNNTDGVLELIREELRVSSIADPPPETSPSRGEGT
jgi:hypothetical protein